MKAQAASILDAQLTLMVARVIEYVDTLHKQDAVMRSPTAAWRLPRRTVNLVLERPSATMAVVSGGQGMRRHDRIYLERISTQAGTRAYMNIQRVPLKWSSSPHWFRHRTTYKDHDE